MRALIAVLLLLAVPAFAQSNNPYPGITAPGSTTARSAVSRAGDIYNVKDYGVVCNGSTDTTAALQALATKVGTGQAEVYFPAGNCILSGAINWTGNYIHLHGSGQATIITQTADAVDTFVFANATPVTVQSVGNSIDNMWIRRTAATTSGVGLSLYDVNNFQSTNLTITNFYEDLRITGGAGIQFANFKMTSGAYFPSILSGSSMLHLVANVGGGYPPPTEVTFSNFDWTCATNNYCDKAINIEAVDGVWFSSGHAGFSQTQVFLYPTVNNVSVQTVHFGNVGIDGSSSAPTGISIPLMTTTGNIEQDIQFTGGDIVEGVTANCVDIREPTAELSMIGNLRNCGGWGIYGYNFGKLSFDGNFLTNGFKVASTGSVYLGTIGNTHINARMFVSAGTCVTAPTGLNGQPGIDIAETDDGSCTGHVAHLVSSGATAAAQLTGNAGSFGFGLGAQAVGPYSTAMGAFVNATGQYAIAMGTQSYLGGQGSVGLGQFVSDEGRYGADCFASGHFAKQGDAKSCTSVLRNTVTGSAGTVTARLTADGTAARTGGAGSNCVNLPVNSAAALQIVVTAYDTTNTASSAAWVNIGGLLNQDATAATTAWHGSAGGAPTYSVGTSSGLSLALTADTTNACLNVSVTTPSANTDTWDLVATVISSETKK